MACPRAKCRQGPGGSYTPVPLPPWEPCPKWPGGQERMLGTLPAHFSVGSADSPRLTAPACPPRARGDTGAQGNGAGRPALPARGAQPGALSAAPLISALVTLLRASLCSPCSPSRARCWSPCRRQKDATGRGIHTRRLFSQFLRPEVSDQGPGPAGVWQGPFLSLDGRSLAVSPMVESRERTHSLQKASPWGLNLNI